MTPVQFKATLQMLVPAVVRTLMTRQKTSLLPAVSLFYQSNLYRDLENEKTKLWHLSSAALIDLLQEELATGKINYPEEA
ncbi:hypothetical protein FACS1894107_03750 [Planctomycetales bacterium]|nr:hypothetical protein FACS1894107_03750 [Planctomycetales bacterium]GHT01602.1 hypothetical protein FACS1894108_15480 [Planctomycetales bacterium]GHV23177.1 hypothetical protein AGMMS49959_15480 [Planctomycetales bacterium]